MPSIPFEEIWSRIAEHAGETFHTIPPRSLEFTYSVDRNGFYPSRTVYRISKEDFRTAYQMVPIKGPGVINNIVRGPSYVWAVLHDQRISLGEW